MPRRVQYLLIKTKLNWPLIDEKWVERSRLITSLEEGLKRRVTLICAPAGFGKTSLAAQWLNQRNGPSAWLSLERNDDEPERFLRYVITALDTAVPGICTNVAGLLSAVQLPPPDYLADAMISCLEALKEPLAVVLDDYHALTSDAVQRMVVRMIENLPKNLHLVILSRVDPPWPVGRWRGRQWLNELRAADISFTEAETRELFRQYGLSDDSIGMIYRRTEGWAAGLLLMRLSLENAANAEESIRQFSDSDRLIVDYFMDEVISQQPSHILDFLSATAMLDRFCASLSGHMLADVLGGYDSLDLIALLEKENLFLVPLDNERTWYRYHHLFQNLITHHLMNRMSPERKAQLYRRAAEWFARQGSIEQAIGYYLAGDDVEAAAGLVEENLHAIIDGDLSRRRLKRLLELFPPKSESNNLALLVAHAYVQLFSWNFPVVRQLHDQIEELLHKAGDTISESRRLSFQGDLEAQRAFRRYQLGDIKAALESARRALVLVPKEHMFARGLAIMYTAAGYAARDSKEMALRFLEDIIYGSADSGSKFAGQVGLTQMAIHFYAGDLNRVLGAAELMLARNEHVRVPDYYLGFAHYFRGSVAYERNELAAAVEHFEAVAGMRYFVMPSLYHDCLIGLAMVSLNKGETDRARELLHVATTQAQEANDLYPLGILEAMTVRVAIPNGISSCGPPVPPRIFEGNRFLLLTPSLVRAENATIKGETAECLAALPIIDAVIEQANRFRNLRQVIQFLTVKAMLLKCAGRSDKALDVLEETLRMAEPFGFVRTFLDRGPLMADLMRSLLKKNYRDRYLRELLAAFDREESRVDWRPTRREKVTEASGKEVMTGAKPVFQLSNREIDVLILLEQRLSNKEIAQRLSISNDTVKTHTINIFRKLEANGRRQAVTMARQLGLLP